MNVDAFVPVSKAKTRLLELLRKIEEEHGSIVITAGFTRLKVRTSS